MTQLRTGSDLIRSVVNQGKKVYVHCKMGHGRSPTLVAAYLISQNKSVNEALDLIKSKRPEIHLEKEQALSLEEFSRNIA